MRVTAVLVVVGTIACATAISEGRYENHLSSDRQELLKEMAACAGRQKGLAKIAAETEQPAAAELHRRGAMSFRQCALYLGITHDQPGLLETSNGEASVESTQRIVDREAEAAEQLLLSEVKRAKIEEATSLIGQCRDLESELRACSDDQQRFSAEAKILKKQKEAELNRQEAPSKPSSQ